jgi:hypothetical protein
MQELNTEAVVEHAGKHRQDRRDHVNRMDRRRIPRQILQYVPGDRKSIGRRAKNWLKTVTDHMVWHVWKIIM